MKLRLILATIGLLFVVVACAPEPQLRSDSLLQDNSFISGEPCGPPCWRGITPGKTTWNEALTIIEDDPTLKDLQTRAGDDSEIGATWAQADGDGCCQMFTEDGTIVDLIILQTAPQTALNTVIETHGEPTYLIGETVSSDQGIFSLIYPDIPMLIYVFIEGEEGQLAPESEIIGFMYLTEDLMQFLIDTSELHGWEGYQAYTNYVDSDIVVTPRITLTPSDN